jgi:hypothetical protein
MLTDVEVCLRLGLEALHVPGLLVEARASAERAG